MHLGLILEQPGELRRNLICRVHRQYADVEEALILALSGQGREIGLGQDVELDLALGEAAQKMPVTFLVL